MIPEKKTRRSRKKRLVILLAVLLFVSVLGNFLLLQRSHVAHQTIIEQKKQIVQMKEPEDATSEINGKWYGLCGKNQVHSIDDFRRIVASDGLLTEHFSDFDWNNARMGRQESALWTHVAYRKNGRIATTRKAIRLPKNDGYITDGKRWVRTFCCNDYVLASRPDQAAEMIEPDVPQKVAELIDTDAERLREKSDSSLRKTDDDDFAVVPEPATFLLFGGGAMGIGFARFLRKRPR